MKQSGLSVNEVWKKYFICISTMKSIMKDASDYENLRDKVFEDLQIHPTKWEDIQSLIRTFIGQHWVGVRAKKIELLIPYNPLSKPPKWPKFSKYRRGLDNGYKFLDLTILQLKKS